MKNLSLKKLYEEQAAYFPLLYAFLLPFGVGMAIVMVIWLTAMVFSGHFIPGAKALLKNKWFLLVFAFFLAHVISALTSSQVSEQGQSIEVKLCFFAFPFLLSGTKLRALQLMSILNAFIAGCFLATVLCLVRAVYLYLVYGEYHFYYNSFSWFLHPSYYAMYLVMATIAVLIWYPQWFAGKKGSVLGMALLLTLLPLAVFLCASKMGLITFAIFVPATVIYLLLKRRYYKLVGGFLAFAVLAFSLSYKFLPEPFERMQRALAVSSSTATIDKTSAESTAVRILIWEQAIDLIRQHPLFGTGVADANDDLYERYQQEGLRGAYDHRLNAHNQFLQTTLGLGLIGALLMGLLTFGTLIWGLIRKNVMLVLFSLLIILNFLVESMLQTQAGNLFYVFFLCVFLQYDFNKVDIVAALKKEEAASSY